MTLKRQVQQLNNRLDKCRHQLRAAEERHDSEQVVTLGQELSRISQQLEGLKSQQSSQLSSQGAGIKAMAFHRPLTKKEQADMGALKKSVRGLVVVHPMTALGRECGLEVVTGFAPAAF